MKTMSELKTIVRAHTLGIIAHDINADDWWKIMHQAWNATQRAANAAVRVYVALDDAKMIPGKSGKMTLDKLPAEVSRAAYAAAIEAARSEISAGSVSDICQRVRSRYLHDRWGVQVAMKQSVPTFRRPLPLSIRRQDWQSKDAPNNVFTAFDGDREIYLARFGIAGMKGENRPVIRFLCKTGRDAALLAKIASGEYPARTLEILPPGWERKGGMRAKIVYERPAAEPREANGVFKVATARDALLVAGDFKWNASWLKHKIKAYERDRRERSEDLKHELRTPSKRREVYREDSGKRAEKHRNRVRTALQQIAAQVAGRAVRAKCAAVEYDDSCRKWMDQFPWHDLKERIEQACESKGLTFTIKTKEVPAKK